LLDDTVVILVTTFAEHSFPARFPAIMLLSIREQAWRASALGVPETTNTA
jgi:hypothetical protein